MEASPHRSILLDGLAGKASYFVARMQTPAWVRKTPELTVASSGIPSDTFNCVIGRDLGGPEDASVIAEVCSGFNSAGLPAAWWTCDGLRADSVAGELAKHRFVEDETEVGMLAELASIPPAAALTSLEVSPVRTADGVLEFGRLLASLSDPPDAQTLAYYAAVSEIGEPGDGPMRLFLGYDGGRALSTASLFLDGDTAHVFDVSTPPASRCRGLGTAMMRAVLEHARGGGAKRAGLEASADGLGIYRRLGFEEVCLFRVYSNRRAIAEIRRA